MTEHGQIARRKKLRGDLLLHVTEDRRVRKNKKLSWETVRRESMPRIAEMDVEMTT